MKLKIFGATLCALSLFFSSLHAETKTAEGYTIRLKAAKDGGVYSVGDAAEFVLSITKDGKPANLEFSGGISKDGYGNNLESFNTTTVDGKFSTVEKLSEPGVLRCRILVKLPSGKEIDLLAGAAFDPKKIKPSQPMPKDFAKYWQEQRKILSGIPMNVVMTPVESTDKNIEVFDVKADSFNGLMRGYYARPKGAKKGTMPAMLLTHGAGVRSSNKGNAIMWAKRGFIALDFNAHGIENGKDEAFYKNLGKTTLRGYPYFGSDARDTSFFRALFMRDMRAMDFLEAQPEWDGKILVVYGGSQGGGQAIACAALNPKVSLTVPLVPAMCDHTGEKISRISGWPKLATHKNVKNKDAVLEASRYVDAMNFASLVKCNSLFNINLADNVCAPTSGFAAYNNVKGRKSVIITEEARHRVAKEARAQCDNAILKHAGKLPAPKKK